MAKQQKHQAKSGSKPKRRSKNRQIVLAGQTVFASVRTMHRFYLLKPDHETNEAILYLLGHYGQMWGMEILAFSFMSNHYHLVAKDTLGMRPNFFRDFNRSLAQFLKAKHGWSGAVFKKMAPPVVLRSAFAVADKIGYTLANPVAAGAVRFPKEWPGVISRIEDMGRKRYERKRPVHYFGRRKTLPDTSAFPLRMCEWLVESYGSVSSAEGAPSGGGEGMEVSRRGPRPKTLAVQAREVLRGLRRSDAALCDDWVECRGHHCREA